MNRANRANLPTAPMNYDNPQYVDAALVLRGARQHYFDACESYAPDWAVFTAKEQYEAALEVVRFEEDKIIAAIDVRGRRRFGRAS